MSVTSWLAKASVSPALIYLKLIAIGALVAGATYISWSYRGALAEQEKQEAVNIAVSDAVKTINKELEQERAWRATFTAKADTNLVAMLDAVKGIARAQAVFQADIREEIAKSPEFYQQPLPPGGYEVWKKARESAR